MGGTTVLPPSLLLPRRSAADLQSRSSRVRVNLNPALMANTAAAKKPKRPVPVSDDEQPPAKRVCSGGELHAAVAANININSSSLPCLSSGEDPRSPTCRHPSVSVIKNSVAGSPEKSKPPVTGRGIRELIENARLAKARAAAEEEEASRRRDVESSKPPRPSSGEDPKSPAYLRSSATKNQAESPESAPESKPPASMRELIEKARLAGRRRDIERSRAEARRKVEQMVDTVQFNDPWIDHSDVTRSPEELLRARQEAWCAQAQLIAMARRRAEADPFFVQPCWW